MFHNWRVLLTFNRNIRLFLLAWALIAFAYFGVQGVLLNLYLLRLGFGTQFIGSLIASGQIVWALAALPAGAIGRGFGLRTALIASAILSALGNSLLLIVEWFPREYWPSGLYVAWIIAWLGAALLTVNGIPYLLHASSTEERNHAFAFQGAVIALFGFAGSLAAGFLPGIVAVWSGHSLEESASFWYPLFLVPVMHLICVVVWASAGSVEPTRESASSESTSSPIGIFIFFGLVVFLQTAGEGSVRAFFNIYLDKTLVMPSAHIGLIFGIGQLLPVFMSLITPSLLARWGASRVLGFTSLMAGLVSIPLAVIQHWAAATFGFVGVLSMLAINAPSRSIFSQEIVPPRWRTTTAAIATIGIGLGWASTALAGGYLIPRVGFSGLFWIGAVLAFIAAILVWSYVKVVGNKTSVGKFA